MLVIFVFGSGKISPEDKKYLDKDKIISELSSFISEWISDLR